jgi:hypothetical protein
MRGDLDALALTVPGVSVGGGGVSVFGLSPAQNSRTLNGLAFNGGSVPRAAVTQTRLATSTYDPARGGFSGAQTQVTIAPGTAYTRRRAFLTFDSPALQVPDALARHAGIPYSSLDLNLGADGPAKMDRWVYNTGIQLKRRSQDVVSMLTAPGDVLQHSGVAGDSVARLVTALQSVGAPIRSGYSGGSSVTDAVSFIARVDRPLFDYNTFTPTSSTWGLVGFANYARDGVVNFVPTTLPTAAKASTRFAAGLQASYSAYTGKQHQRLNELRSAVSLTEVTEHPFVRLPNGRVLVSSEFPDGTGDVATLQIGGSGVGDARNTGLTWEVSNESQFYWKGHAAHRGKVLLNSRVDTYLNVPASNEFGTFTFNSIADVASNRPSTFTRTFRPSRRALSVWNGAASLSDNWSPLERLSLIYGVRLDGSAPITKPAADPELARILGTRTDAAPFDWQVSPRVGFNWYYTGTRAGRGASSGPMGTFYTVPSGVIRGGIGQFRDVLDPNAAAAASAPSGFGDANSRLQCVGDAVPAPSWAEYAADPERIPAECASTATVPSFASYARDVGFLSNRYRPSRSWRANLSWSSTFKALQYSIDGVYSLHLNQASVRDENFPGVEQFALPAEGGRPVFVPVDAIAPASGAVAAAAGRISPTYSSVMGRYSDLRGQARQVTVRVRPAMNFVGGWRLDGAYTYTAARSERRGFDGATFGDPTAVTWSRSDFAPTHEFIASGGYANSWAVLTFFGKAMSGMPFTPLVGSDVNGDGFANDRAFVRDAPAVVSRKARRCLLRQMNGAAQRNSCEGPWSAVLNASIGVGDRLLRPLRRVARVEAITVNLTNPLGGLDQLLHGNDLRGWGTAGYPDPVLYSVRSFDPGARRFNYGVNPRFGKPLLSSTSLRVPFRVTLDVQLDFGQPTDEQQVRRMLRNGRDGNPGPKLDSAAILRRYCGNLPDWYMQIINEADSLLLSREQVAELHDARTSYRQGVKDHWGRLAGFLAAVPDGFDASYVIARQREANEGAWELARQEAITMLPKILTRVQLGLLPGNASDLYHATEPIVGVRYSSTNTC